MKNKLIEVADFMGAFIVTVMLIEAMWLLLVLTGKYLTPSQIISCVVVAFFATLWAKIKRRHE
mgnify:CR=1 FL=1